MEFHCNFCDGTGQQVKDVAVSELLTIPANAEKECRFCKGTGTLHIKVPEHIDRILKRQIQEYNKFQKTMNEENSK